MPDQGRVATGAWPDGTGIRTPDQRLRVFVSSTLAELTDERRAVSRAITTLRLTPVMFELDELFAAGAGLSQQDAVTAARLRHGEGVRAS